MCEALIANEENSSREERLRSFLNQVRDCVLCGHRVNTTVPSRFALSCLVNLTYVICASLCEKEFAAVTRLFYLIHVGSCSICLESALGRGFVCSHDLFRNLRSRRPSNLNRNFDLDRCKLNKCRARRTFSFLSNRVDVYRSYPRCILR